MIIVYEGEVSDYVLLLLRVTHVLMYPIKRLMRFDLVVNTVYS